MKIIAMSHLPPAVKTKNAAMSLANDVNMYQKKNSA